MIKESKPLRSSPARSLRRVNSSPVGDLSKFKSRSNKRLRKPRSLDYTCQTNTTAKIRVAEGVVSETKKIKVFAFSEIQKNDLVSMPDGDDQPPRYGVISVIGKRHEMEDTVRAELGFAASGGEKFDFFGVYDGHGGVHVAGTCRERLHEILAAEMVGFERDSSEKDSDNGRDWERVMEVCFGKMDEEVRGNAAARTVGATALTAVVAEDEVVVANCGDCRAVLCRDGAAFPLSIDHKPNRPDELERIEALGGKVINWNGYRVLGVLATSRSIGDQYLSPFVISIPEITVTKRSNKDEFLILASDGLWDVISNEVACKVVKKCLDGKINRKLLKDMVLDCGNRASVAATVLAELAMAWGSRDNISVIVVELRKS